jgi:hypothetical protein
MAAFILMVIMFGVFMVAGLIACLTTKDQAQTRTGVVVHRQVTGK